LRSTRKCRPAASDRSQSSPSSRAGLQKSFSDAGMQTHPSDCDVPSFSRPGQGRSRAFAIAARPWLLRPSRALNSPSQGHKSASSCARSPESPACFWCLQRENRGWPASGQTPPVALKNARSARANRSIPAPHPLKPAFDHRTPVKQRSLLVGTAIYQQDKLLGRQQQPGRIQFAL